MCRSSGPTPFMGGEDPVEDVVLPPVLPGPLHGDDVLGVGHHAHLAAVPLLTGADGAGPLPLGEVLADGTQGRWSVWPPEWTGQRSPPPPSGRERTKKASRWAVLCPMPGRRANCSTIFSKAGGKYSMGQPFLFSNLPAPAGRDREPAWPGGFAAQARPALAAWFMGDHSPRRARMAPSTSAAP